MDNQEQSKTPQFISTTMQESILLHSKDLSDILEEDDIDDPPFSFRSPEFFKEIKTNIKIGMPMMVINLLQYFLIVETTAITGRLNATSLAGTVLALSLIQALGWNIVGGMVSACDTLMSQAFGSQNKKRTGLFLQRAIILFNIIPFIIWSVHINLEPILMVLGQDSDVARVSTEFVTNFIPGIAFMMNYLLLARYMQNQGCFYPSVIAALFGNIFNVCSQLFFVSYLGYGYKASAICYSISYFSMFIIELVYIIYSKFYIPTWPGFDLECLYDWQQMVTLGLAGIAHTAFEILIWEAAVFIGGLFSKTDLTTNSIFIQLLSVSFLIYFGAGIASNIRVGQCLGANKPNQAKFAYRAGLLNIGLVTLFTFSLIVGLSNYIPYIFTDDKDVVQNVIDTFPYLYVLYLFDPFSGVCIGCFRGCGRQISGAIVMFTGLYIIGLPIGLILAFTFDYGIKGIWIGNTIGDIFIVVTDLIILECQNWRQQAHLAQERITYSILKQQQIENEAPSDAQRLLPTFDEETDLLCHEKLIPSHIRTPSNPVSCSIEYVEMPQPRHGNLPDLNKIIVKRIVSYIFVIILFIASIILCKYLPKDLYGPSNNTLNSTT